VSTTTTNCRNTTSPSVTNEFENTPLVDMKFNTKIYTGVHGDDEYSTNHEFTTDFNSNEKYANVVDNIHMSSKFLESFDNPLESTVSTSVYDHDKYTTISTSTRNLPENLSMDCFQKNVTTQSFDVEAKDTGLHEDERLLKTLIDNLHRYPYAKRVEKLREMNELALSNAFFDDVNGMVTIPIDLLGENAKMVDTIKSAGRKKSIKRLRDKDEKVVENMIDNAAKKRQYTCSRCKQVGHKVQTCTAKI